MENEEEQQNFFKEYKGVLIAGVVLVVVVLGLILNFFLTQKSLAIVQESKPISLKAGDSYTIKWNSSKIDKVGIVLYKDGKPTWIARDVYANQKEYKWNIFIYQKPGADYKLAVFEYPWKSDSFVSYTTQSMEIIGPKYASCDTMSIENEWPYIPSTYEDLHRVFITDSKYGANFNGLEGADEKCQQEAQKKKLSRRLSGIYRRRQDIGQGTVAENRRFHRG